MTIGAADTAQTLRPKAVSGRTVQELVQWLQAQGFTVGQYREGAKITGISMDSRQVQAGDLYVGLPGAKSHGAQYVQAAIAAGAHAILTDEAGLALLGTQAAELGLIQCEQLRACLGPLASFIYNSQPEDGSAPLRFAVTGTNGKTTTTYMLNSLLESLGHTTGLIGTIEILAGGEPIPSQLTTPESVQVHSLLALMRQQGITAMSMEVSSHALDYRRVDGLRYDLAGFTNLTQDHLDLHHTMANYRDSKAELFTLQRARRAVIVADDHWGEQMLGRAIGAMGIENVVALFTRHGAGADQVPADLAAQDWVLTDVQRTGLGHAFKVVRGDGLSFEAQTQLPADFNVSNAALALVMAYEAGADPQKLRKALRKVGALTPVVPGRMQLLSQAPVAIVDFAHNPDALQRSLQALTPLEGSGKVIIVFGATGERDQLKRPIMGEIAAQYADIVIVTDDDPHDEEPAPIREEIMAGILKAQRSGARVKTVLNLAPRAAAIARAFELAGPADAVMVAGRGHEVAQEVAGVNVDLDDRVEVVRSLKAKGYEVLPDYQMILGDA